jgi:uncharacterized protein YqhQ
MRKILMGGAVTLMVALLLGMTTWNFAATQGAVQEKDHKEVHDSIEKKLDKIYDKIVELHTK